MVKYRVYSISDLTKQIYPVAKSKSDTFNQNTQSELNLLNLLDKALHIIPPRDLVFDSLGPGKFQDSLLHYMTDQWNYLAYDLYPYRPTPPRNTRRILTLRAIDGNISPGSRSAPPAAGGRKTKSKSKKNKRFSKGGVVNLGIPGSSTIPSRSIDHQVNFKNDLMLKLYRAGAFGKLYVAFEISSERDIDIPEIVIVPLSDNPYKSISPELYRYPNTQIGLDEFGIVSNENSWGTIMELNFKQIVYQEHKKGKIKTLPKSGKLPLPKELKLLFEPPLIEITKKSREELGDWDGGYRFPQDFNIKTSEGERVVIPINEIGFN